MESLDLTHILLEADAEFDAANLPNMEHGATVHLDEEIAVEAQLVEQIPPEKSGKYCYFVSRVALSTGVQ